MNGLSLKETNYKLCYFGISRNSKHVKYNECEMFIAIQLKTMTGHIKTTDIILNKDNSLKAILSELTVGECKELFIWLINNFHTKERQNILTVIDFDGIEFLSEDGYRVEGIYSDTLSKEDIERYCLESLETKGGNY